MMSMGSHHEYFFLLTIAAVFFSSARFCSSFSSYRHIATTATNIKKFAMSQPSASTSSWNVESGVDPLLISQSQFMESDTVLVLDNNDNVISSASKKASHEFSPAQPHGILHRAFSVFLFDKSTNELLLQKRASTKITFPNVWTNTCCSHPLHGMHPSESECDGGGEMGNVTGVKHAAVRKLKHELGVPIGELKLEDFKYLTRVHYWAADTVTHGEMR
jgi:isopentenyl-diphosphate delta-isomerase type 1